MGHGYLLYYSIHFCACLKFSIVIHLKTVYFLLEQSLLQQHNSKASVLQGSAFFMVQFSHPSVTTGKTIALTIWTFFGKVISLLLNMLSRLVITFLPRSKPRKIKSDTVSIVSPSICHEVMGLYAKVLVFHMLSFKPTFSLSSFTFLVRLP